MKRERLMSGQVWYFDEDGTSLKIDLVVDIWDKVRCKETSQVMIGGLWYQEDVIQKLVSGRRNSLYECTVPNAIWCYDYVTGDLEIVRTVVNRYIDKYFSWEIDESVLLDITKKVMFNFDEFFEKIDGFRGFVHGTWFNVEELVKVWCNIAETTKIR